MKAILQGGPYDGTALDDNDVNLYTRFIPVGIRQFIMMPPIESWEAVRRGDVDKAGPFDGDSPIYELIRTRNGMEGRYDSVGSTFAAALQQQKAGRQPIPEVEFTGQYFKCYRGDLRDITLPRDYFMITDEKDRKWSCVAVSQAEGESGDLGEMLPLMGGEPLSEPLQIVTLHCDYKDELPAKLADQTD